MTVVVGSATPFAVKLAPHVIARAVPLSLIWKTKTSPIDGVPVRLVVIDVIAAASAVMFTMSQLSVLTVGVPDDVIVVTRGVIRLLVSVVVLVACTAVSALPSDV